MNFNYESEDPFQQEKNSQNIKDEITKFERDFLYFHKIAKLFSKIFIFFNCKIWTIISISIYLYILFKYANWTQNEGFKQLYPRSVVILVIYKFLKTFSLIHSQQFTQQLIKQNQQMQNQKRISKFLFALTKPFQLFLVSNIICQMILINNLQIIFFSIFFGTFAPLITKMAQEQLKQLDFVQILKGNYFFIVFLFLLFLSIKPFASYILIFDYYLPQCCIFCASIYIFCLFFILLFRQVRRIILQKNNLLNSINFRQLVCLLSLIYVPLVHFIIGYHLDTILNTIFIQKNGILIITSLYLGSKFIQQNLKIKMRKISLLHIVFLSSFSILIPIVYIFPIYGKMGDIVIYCVYEVLFIIPSVYLFFKQISIGAYTLKVNSSKII